ncbi:MAG: FAD-dependent oxidoreductase, partial [Gammaproteobacteria bacterium]
MSSPAVMEDLSMAGPESQAPRPDSVPPIDTADDPIVIVGSGPVGVRFAARVAELGSDRPVLLLGDEPERPYDRVRLSSLVAREMTPDTLATSSELDRFDQITVAAGCRIVRIDRQEKRVV